MPEWQSMLCSAVDKINDYAISIILSLDFVVINFYAYPKFS